VKLIASAKTASAVTCCDSASGLETAKPAGFLSQPETASAMVAASGNKNDNLFMMFVFNCDYIRKIIADAVNRAPVNTRGL
jgi:hypothetical protein